MIVQQCRSSCFYKGTQTWKLRSLRTVYYNVVLDLKFNMGISRVSSGQSLAMEIAKHILSNSPMIDHLYDVKSHIQVAYVRARDILLFYYNTVASRRLFSTNNDYIYDVYKVYIYILYLYHWLLFFFRISLLNTLYYNLCMILTD